MAKITFWRVLKSNLKCAVCKTKNCPVRYYPERKNIVGRVYVAVCEKDRQDFIDKTLKKPLP